MRWSEEPLVVYNGVSRDEYGTQKTEHEGSRISQPTCSVPDEKLVPNRDGGASTWGQSSLQKIDPESICITSLVSNKLKRLRRMKYIGLNIDSSKFPKRLVPDGP